jgi:hypothetical protein
MSHPYRGVEAVITTQHAKEKLIAPALAPLGIELVHHNFNTDSLGTFSGEIPRTHSQRETAFKKARIGMEVTGLKYGIASEGSIGADPLVPLINSAIESIAWIDDVTGIEIIEFERGTEVVAVKTEVSSIDDLGDFLERADFPNHALIAYPASKKGPNYKGLRELAALEDAISSITKVESAVIESDLRAHMSPSRSEVIQRCAEKLAVRLACLCSGCGTPGFGAIGSICGLSCEQCGEIVERAISGELHGCAKCEFREEKLNGKSGVSAAQCERCNP